MAKYFKTLTFQYQKKALLGNYFWRINVAQISVSPNELLMLRWHACKHKSTSQPLPPLCCSEKIQAVCEGVGRKDKILTVTYVGGTQNMSPFSPVFHLIFCKKDKREGRLERWGHLTERSCHLSLYPTLYRAALLSCTFFSVSVVLQVRAPHQHHQHPKTLPEMHILGSPAQIFWIRDSGVRAQDAHWSLRTTAL